MSTNSTAVSNGSETQLEEFLTRAGAKERAKIEKHLTACDNEADREHGQLWRRVVLILGSLAPAPVQSVGHNAWRFFIPDGKYRLQVFALEDGLDGFLRIYLPDVVSEAVKAKILTKTDMPNEFAVRGSRKPLNIEAMDAENTSSPGEHYKHMLGWNRKALRLTLPTTESSGPLVEATAALLKLAADAWSAARVGAKAAQ